MRGSCTILLLFCLIVGYNCAEIFVPRFTADHADLAGGGQNALTTDVKALESSDIEPVPNDKDGDLEDDAKGWLPPSFWRIFEALFDSHWYKGKNVCKNVSTSTVELNATLLPVARLFKARKCLEADGTYSCVTTVINGTHETRTVEEFTCCPGYRVNYDRQECTALVVRSLKDVLTANNATNLEQALENRDLAGHTVFVFPNEDSPAGDEVLNAHTTKGVSHLDGRILAKLFTTLANTSIIVEGWSAGPDDVHYSANCRKLLSVNNYISNNSIVHVAEGRVPIASLSILEILASDPELSEANKILHAAINVSRDIEEDEISKGIVYTVFVPTNKALEKFFQEWPAAKEDKKILSTLVQQHIGEHVIVCASDDADDSIIKRVNRSGVATLEFKGARIAKANIPARNGIVHILDEMIQLPLQYQPLETLLENLKMDEFLKAYSKLKKEWEPEQKGTLTVLLPVDDHANNPYSDKEIRRHVFRDDNETTADGSISFSNVNVYGHVQSPSFLPQLTLNCVPVLFLPLKFRDGNILKVARRIPEGYPDVYSALKSTGEHNLFVKLMEKYAESGGNVTGCTILAVEDATLLNRSESLPNGVRAVLGMEAKAGEEDVEQLKEFIGNLTVNGEICMNGMDDAESLTVASGKHYKVKKDEEGTWIGGAKITSSDLVAGDVIVHGLTGLPKAHILTKPSIWGIITSFGRPFYDIILV